MKKAATSTIAVNSRRYQDKNTGIPYYIKCLYTNLVLKDPNRYTFFQTAKNKTLGNTKVVKITKNSIGAVLFDTLIVHFILLASRNIKLFHGPSNVLPILRKRGVKYVVTIHDLAFLILPEQYSKLFNIYYKFIIKKSLQNADTIVAISKNTKKDIVGFYNIPEEKIEVVYNGINQTFIDTKNEPRAIPDKYFFSLTTHPKRKNLIGALDSFAQNKELQRTYKFIIAGSISSKQMAILQNEILLRKLQKKVVIMGYVEEHVLRGLYQHAEFFIYPSFYEGFGLPVVESMACGCPVITSKGSSMNELVPDERWLINPRDPNDLGVKIKLLTSLSKEERAKLVQKNREFAKSFTWERTAREMEHIFNKLIE